MAGKTPKKQTKMEESVVKRQKLAQIMFAAFAIVLIISMVLSAVATY